MSALKSAVILMGVAIAVLMTLTIYGLYQKSQDPDFKFFDLSGNGKTAAQSIPNAPVSGSPANIDGTSTAFGDVTLDLPPSARIISATSSAQRLTVIVATDGNRANEVWVVDLATGQILGRVKTGP